MTRAQPPARPVSTARTSTARRVALAALSLLLASCTALAPPQEWLRSGAPTGSHKPRKEPPARAASPGETPRPAAIDRLTWNGAVRLARENSPTISAARSRVLRAKALVEEARSRAYPTLDARASVVRFLEAANFRGRTGSDVSGASTRTSFFTGRGSDIYNMGVDATYPLFDGGDVYYDRRATASGLEASRHDSEEVLDELDLQVSAAFLNVLLSAGEIEIAEESLEFTEEQEKQARAREEAGEGLQVDRLRFAARASEERLAVNRARATRQVRIAVLSELLGVPVGESTEFVSPTEPFAFPEGDLVATALARRPELLALRARVEEAEHRLSRERSSWWPDLDLFASYGFLSLDDAKLDDQKDEFQVGAALAMNLFEGGATSARTAVLRQEVRELRDRERGIALTVEREVRAAEADLRVAKENVEVSRETVALSEEVLTRVSAQYKAGEAQVIDVTEAELQRTRSRLAYLRSQVDELLAGARLRRATRTGLRGPEASD